MVAAASLPSGSDAMGNGEAIHRRVRDAVYGSSPYEGFPAAEYPPDLQGWDSRHPIFEELIRSRRPRRILEVGTWKGASAIHMAHLCRRYAVPCEEIVCVDTWLGDPNILLNWDPVTGDYRPSSNADDLLRRFGYPQLYYTFLRNVVEAHAEDLITPLPLSSDAAFFTLKKLGYAADLIYIDASHEYESVRQDLDLYWRLLAPGGVLLGDDYVGDHPGVAKAADEFSRVIGTPLVAVGRKYLFEHPLSANRVPPTETPVAGPAPHEHDPVPWDGSPNWADVLAAPAFVISLDRRPDRRAVSVDRVKAAGFGDVRRWPAVDGRDPTALDAAWAACDRPGFDPADADFVAQPGRQGCFLSHLLLWEAMILDETPFASVFEDDATFHALWPVLAPAYFAATPPDYDILFFGARIVSPMSTFVQRRPTFNTNAYLITLAGARLLHDRILGEPNGVRTVDVMINRIQEEALAGGADSHGTPLVWFVWNGAPFLDPKATEAPWFANRNMGLVFQDWTKGSTVDELNWTS